MQIFKSNEFFAGVTLPVPHTFEPIEEKLPKQQNIYSLDFFKANMISFVFCFVIKLLNLFKPVCLFVFVIEMRR